MNAKWIENPEWPEATHRIKGWYEIEGIKPDKFVPAEHEEIDDPTFGHLYLWKQSCYIRGCDEGILGYLEADESNPLVGNLPGLSVSEIRKRYKESQQ